VTTGSNHRRFDEAASPPPLQGGPVHAERLRGDTGGHIATGHTAYCALWTPRFRVFISVILELITIRDYTAGMRQRAECDPPTDRAFIVTIDGVRWAVCGLGGPACDRVNADMVGDEAAIDAEEWHMRYSPRHSHMTWW
jgi:hypothetical protein